MDFTGIYRKPLGKLGDAEIWAVDPVLADLGPAPGFVLFSHGMLHPAIPPGEVWVDSTIRTPEHVVQTARQGAYEMKLMSNEVPFEVARRAARSLLFKQVGALKRFMPDAPSPAAVLGPEPPTPKKKPVDYSSRYDDEKRESALFNNSSSPQTM